MMVIFAKMRCWIGNDYDNGEGKGGWVVFCFMCDILESGVDDLEEALDDDFDNLEAFFFFDLPNNSNTSNGAIYPCLSLHLKYLFPFTLPSCLPFGSSNSTPT